jgi:3-hydroxyacyl-[acyl-carrier protein] dehydratase/trans-2-decenoyl-[acyl-carrier protein] isomerase
MKYGEFLTQTNFSQHELLAMAHGTLVDDPPSEFLRLPAPPMLMLDRVTEIVRGARGRIVAEQDVRLTAWFFQCHFIGDPVQPGCLGLDAIWQTLGFYLAANGNTGHGRALGCGEVEFFGQIRPHNNVVRYEVDVRRYARIGSALVIADARVFVDDEEIYSIRNAKSGLFRDIAYADFPRRSKNSTGGRISGRSP